MASSDLCGLGLPCADSRRRVLVCIGAALFLFAGLELHLTPHDPGQAVAGVAVAPTATHAGESSHFESSDLENRNACMACALSNTKSGMASAAEPAFTLASAGESASRVSGPSGSGPPLSKSPRAPPTV